MGNEVELKVGSDIVAALGGVQSAIENQVLQPYELTEGAIEEALGGEPLVVDAVTHTTHYQNENGVMVWRLEKSAVARFAAAQEVMQLGGVSNGAAMSGVLYYNGSLAQGYTALAQAQPVNSDWPVMFHLEGWVRSGTSVQPFTLRTGKLLAGSPTSIFDASGIIAGSQFLAASWFYCSNNTGNTEVVLRFNNPLATAATMLANITVLVR